MILDRKIFTDGFIILFKSVYILLYYYCLYYYYLNKSMSKKSIQHYRSSGICDLFNINTIFNNTKCSSAYKKKYLHNTFGRLTKVTFTAEPEEWKKNSRIAKVCLHKTWQCDLHKIYIHTHTLTHGVCNGEKPNNCVQYLIFVL